MLRCPLILLVSALLAACSSGQMSLAPSATPPVSPPSPAPATIGAEPSAAPAPQATASPAQPAGGAPRPITIVYQNLSDGSVAAIDTATGAVTILADPTEHMQRLPFSLSPDGQTLALISGRGWARAGQTAAHGRAALWVVSVAGASPRKLLDLQAGDALPFEPPGAALALTSDRFQLLPWTPDGRAVVVASAHAGQVDLYRVAADGSGARQLTHTPDLELRPHLSPDVGALAYASAATLGDGRNWGGVNAWVQGLMGGSARSIMIELANQFPPADVEIGGWLSNDEVVSRAFSTNGSAGMLWSAGRTTGRAQHQSAAGAVWAVQGSSVAFTDGFTDGVMLWDGTTPGGERVAEAQGVRALHLAPDARTLLVCTGEPGQAQALHVVAPGGLRRFGTGACDHVAWAGDGRRFAVGGSAPFGTSGLIVGADGGVQHALPVGALPVGWSGGTLFFFAPPDDAPQRWQLYRTEGAWSEQVAPIGAPVAGEPAAPRLARQPV